MASNQLKLNPDKTHLMVMGPKRMMARRQQVSIQAGDFTIKPTETERLLGGHLHQSLQWNHHLFDSKKSLSKQLTSRINGLKKVAGRFGNSGGTREPSSQKEFGFAESFFDFEVFTELNSKNVSEITAKIICFA